MSNTVVYRQLTPNCPSPLAQLINVNEGLSMTLKYNAGGAAESFSRHVAKMHGLHSDIILEINIRLAGFGGLVPTKEYTLKTKESVTKFQKDYMIDHLNRKIPRFDANGNITTSTDEFAVPEAKLGDADELTLRAIDAFSKEYDITESEWEALKCKNCTNRGTKNKVAVKCDEVNKKSGVPKENKCNDWGSGYGRNEYRGPRTESFHKYEYPGIHRSLLFAVKALKFYFSKKTLIKDKGSETIYFNGRKGTGFIISDSVTLDKKGKDGKIIKETKTYSGYRRYDFVDFTGDVGKNTEEIKYSISHIESGYRCQFRGYSSTNHQGKAIDIHFLKNKNPLSGCEKCKNAKDSSGTSSGLTRNEILVELRRIRDCYFSLLGAVHNKGERYNGNVGGQTWKIGHFSMEPIGLEKHATNDVNYTYSWLHLDVRDFGKNYLNDSFFCKNSKELNKENLIELHSKLTQIGDL